MNGYVGFILDHMFRDVSDDKHRCKWSPQPQWRASTLKTNNEGRIDTQASTEKGSIEQSNVTDSKCRGNNSILERILEVEAEHNTDLQKRSWHSC